MVKPGFNFSEFQIERLRILSKVIDIPTSELARRAVDEYLERIWPMYGDKVERSEVFAQHRELMEQYEAGELESMSLDELKQRHA